MDKIIRMCVSAKGWLVCIQNILKNTSRIEKKLVL